MASTVKNLGGKPFRLTRGVAGTGPAGAQPSPLGVVTSQNDVVAFFIPEPTRDNQGVLVIQSVGGVTPTYALEVSIDGGATFGTLGPTTTLSSASFGDTSSFIATYPVSGMGAGAQFRFGRTDATGGAANVFALVG